MDTTIQFKCPSHKCVLARRDEGYWCPTCQRMFLEHPLQDTATRVVDFKLLDPSVPIPCTCNRDGAKTCALKLGDILATTKPAAKTDLSPIAESYFNNKVDFSGKKILDLGCAEGMFGTFFSRKGVCYGLDACCGRMFQKPDDNALGRGYTAIILADGQNVPVADASFGVVFAGEIIEHVLEVKPFLRELRRILEPEGVLALTTPNLVSLSNRFSMLIGDGRGILLPELLMRIAGKKIGYHDRYGGVRYPEQDVHIRFMTFASIRKLLSEEGFEVFHTKGRDRLLTPMKLSGALRNFCDQIIVCARKTK